MNKITHTPWGAPQDQKIIAEGIIRVDTASHGGYFLNEQARAAMPTMLAIAPTFAGPGWYEEDCDWAMVALAFPQYFNGYQLLAAVETAHTMFKPNQPCLPTAVEWMRITQEGVAMFNKAMAFKAAHGCEFRVTSAGTAGKGWKICATNLANTEEIVVSFEVSSGYYDMPQYFTFDDIQRLGGYVLRRDVVLHTHERRAA